MRVRVHTADADATEQFRRVGVGGVCEVMVKGVGSAHPQSTKRSGVLVHHKLARQGLEQRPQPQMIFAHFNAILSNFKIVCVHFGS